MICSATEEGVFLLHVTYTITKGEDKESDMHQTASECRRAYANLSGSLLSTVQRSGKDKFGFTNISEDSTMFLLEYVFRFSFGVVSFE